MIYEPDMASAHKPMTTMQNFEWSCNLDPAEFRRAAIHRQMVLSSASARDLEIFHLSSSAFYISAFNRSVLFYDHMPDSTSYAARLITNSKAATKVFLQRAGLSVPQGRIFEPRQRAIALRYAKTMGFPVVLKAVTGSFGRNVYPSLQNDNDFSWAWRQVPAGSNIIVEKHIFGKDYRLFVTINGCVLAVERLPAFIIGNGRSTILELIEEKNTRRKLNPYLANKLIKLTATSERRISENELELQSVLPKNYRLVLNAVANVAAGGDSVDVTDLVHPAFKEVALRACASVPGMLHVGVDVLAEDISRHPEDQEYAICEINTRPDIALHHFPVRGMPRDAAGALLEALIPGSRPVPKTKWGKLVLRWDRLLREAEISDIKHRVAMGFMTGSLECSDNEAVAVLYGTISSLLRMKQQASDAHNCYTAELHEANEHVPDVFVSSLT